MDIAEVVDDPLLAIGGSLTAIRAEGMVGEEGGQPLAPVALGRIDLDAVAEPGMEDFVAQRGLADKGQAQYLPSQQGEGRQAESGWPAVGGNDVMIVGIRTDVAFKPAQIVCGRFQVGGRQMPLLREEQGVDLQARTDLEAVDGIGGGGEMQCLHRLGKAGARDVALDASGKWSDSLTATKP